MNEFSGILKDAKSGNLPASEWPGFALYLLGRAFWPLIIFLAGAGAAILAYFLPKG